MKIILALLPLILITACSHPLEIVGEGDIISSNGKYNCLLEEQPCSNLVAGDYAVTYTGEPRDGWHFVGWEGCGDQFPDCSFNVPGSTVGQYWGHTAPPLRATFAENSARKNVLVIFDTSGSMNAVAQHGEDKMAYDPSAAYADAGFDDANIYWSADSNTPSIDTGNYFAASSNRCASSFDALANTGNVTTRAQRWRPADGSMEAVTQLVCNGSQFFDWCFPDPPGWEEETSVQWVGDEAQWLSLSSSDQSPLHVECQADVLSAEAGNGPGMEEGFPLQPPEPDAADSQAYTQALASSNISWGNTQYTWYTAHYLNWWYDDTTMVAEKTRLEVAQEVINEIVLSNPSIDFGLQVFNHNGDGITQYWCTGPTYPYWNGNSFGCPAGRSETEGPNTEGDHGGRIVHAIVEDMTLADRNALAGSNGLINSLTAGGWTPLSEATYEAWRYLAGGTPVYGTMQDATNGDPWDGEDVVLDSPDDDTRAIDARTGRYISPITDCGDSYVILMTDGYPTYDTHANAAVEALTGETCDAYPEGFFDNFGNRTLAKNCLPTLTKYMANHDVDGHYSNGDQFAITYTIGFMTDQQLLEDAARNGKGQYFTANSTESLREAFDEAMAEILAVPSPSCE